MTIRRLQAADLEALYAIAAASPEAASWTVEAYEALLGESSHDHCWVAEHEGQVVAFACFRVAGEEAELLNLAVLLGWRRQGMASRLLEHVLQEATAEGAKEMFLEVRGSNRSARLLYERHGFELYGCRPGYYAAPPSDAFLLRCQLRHSGHSPA